MFLLGLNAIAGLKSSFKVGAESNSGDSSQSK